MTESAAGASPEAIPELVELGQRLRRAREGRGIGLAELADRLHLAPEQLTALETADRSHLHEPVFVIAQAKRIAQALGVDISEQIERLRHSRLMKESVAFPQVRHNATPAPTASSTASPGGASAAAAPPPSGIAAPTGPASGTAEEPAAGRPFPARLAVAIAALALLLGVGLALAIRFWGQPRTATAAAPASAPAAGSPAGPGVLQLRSDEPSWVEVRDPEGTVLFSGTLEKEARFRLGAGLEVLAGRPDLVTVSVGGQTPRRLGSISEVAWQTFRPSP